MLKNKGRKKIEHQMNFTNTQPNDKLKGINKNEKKNERNNDTKKKKETRFKLNTR